MDKKIEVTAPPCATCLHVWKAREGYIKACRLQLDGSPLQMYERCLNAEAAGHCQHYQAR